jgi:hypothetical protein
MKRIYHSLAASAVGLFFSSISDIAGDATHGISDTYPLFKTVTLSLTLWYILYVCLNCMQWEQHFMSSIIIADYNPAWPALFKAS